MQMIFIFEDSILTDRKMSTWLDLCLTGPIDRPNPSEGIGREVIWITREVKTEYMIGTTRD